jgi:hypothetical protein
MIFYTNFLFRLTTRLFRMDFLPSSQLYAIQQIPGKTRTEKFKEIGRIVNCIIQTIEEESDFTSAIHGQNVPNSLIPLIKVLVGVKIKSRTFIIDALKSDDIYLIIEALRARWFYDGSNKAITNYKYYSTEILPYVSMSTRRKIVKKLAVCLGNGQVELAENFFDGFVADYGVQEATNLLPACRSDFIYKAIVKYKIVLSNKVLKIIYRKYPELALSYLRFTNPYERRDEIDRTMFRVIDINEYENFMPLLVTNHPEIFVSLQEICHTAGNLGNRRTRMFLKNAKGTLIEKPRDIIELLPFKLVCDNLKTEEFETMFGNILEDRWDMFNVDDMLNYLEYYPEDKKAALLRNKVKEKYGHDLYDKVEKLTSRFLLLLPQHERYILAWRIIEVRHKMEIMDTETSWWCYLPVQHAIPALQQQITKNWKSNKRQKLLSQLIYVCKINDNEAALLDVLRYIDEKHKNERSDVICSMLDRITQEFELETFDENYWIILFNIIRRLKLKKGNARDYWVLIKILKKNVHYCDSRNLSVNEIIDLIVQLFLEGRVGVSWKLLEDAAEYERKYLDACFRHSYWLNMDYKKNIIEGIYSFNERHITKDNFVQRLSIKDYPDLLKIVEDTLKKEQNEQLTWIIYTKEKIKKHEPELYDSWFAGEDDTQYEIFYDDLYLDEEKDTSEIKEKVIYLTEAIIALKRNYNEIKDNWPRYYECCKNEVDSKKRRRVKHFLKALRWYQDIPIKFAERCIEEKNFNIMGYLFEGLTFSRLAQSLLPKELEDDHNMSYLNALHITAAIRNTSTPISIELVQNYLEAYYMYSFKNYINDGLKLWSYVSYRTSSDKMIILSKNLSKSRLFTKRHAIRLMTAMAARNDLVDFFTELWNTEEHPMIRQMLAENIGKLFAKRPSNETWNLMTNCIAGLSANDDDILKDLMGSKAVPVEFASLYVEQILAKLQIFVQDGMCGRDAVKFLDQLFENLKPDCKDHLSEECYKEILTYYLRNADLEFTNADRFVVKVYLNPSSVHFEERLKYLSLILSTESKQWYSLSMVKQKQSINFVDNFVQIVVYQVQKFKGNLRLVENLFDIFCTIFTPYQHASSYIMLFLCTEYMRVEPSFKKFGLKVSEKITSLIEKYTPEYFMQIVELVREFICNFSFYEYSTNIKNRLNFLEGLIEEKNIHGLIIAAKLLNQKIVSEYDHQHCKILQLLSDVNNPIVQSLL